MGRPRDADVATWSLLIPALVSVHRADPAGDVGWLIGWRQAGISGRQRFYESRKGLVLSIAGAAKVSWGFRAGDASAALDAMTPEVYGMRGIARLGLSFGRREYDVELPDDLAMPNLDYPGPAIAHLTLHRVDARLETVAGLSLFHGHLVVSLQPYWVIWHGAAGDAQCNEWCVPGVSLLDFALSRGLAGAITLRL